MKLDIPISLEEMENAVLSLANDKAPSPDGLPAEFYKHNLEWIGPELLELYEDSFNQGSLGADINRGVIKLLPKDGDKTQVKN